MFKSKYLMMTALGIATLGLASACSVEALPDGAESTEQALCSNGDGVWSAAAALAASTANELHRWQPTIDFSISSNYLALTSTGKAQCADKKCAYTQGILDLQKAPNGTVKFNGTLFNADNFRSMLFAKFDAQQACEARPDDHQAANCPAEQHKLTKKSVAKGACDTITTFNANTSSGGTLVEPAQLKNKLLWVGGTDNSYLSFTSTGSTVSIDPTAGLTEASATSSGSCTAACTLISISKVTGACCTCNGATLKYAVSAFSPLVFLCK